MPTAYISPDAHNLRIPTLREIVRNGAWSEGARSVFPTTSYPAHISIAAGANPGTHGIVSNSPWDPLDRNNRALHWYAEDIRVPALWDAARDRGLVTGVIGWPVTVGTRGTVVVPEIWHSGTRDDAKLARALATPGVLDLTAKRFPNFDAAFNSSQSKDEPVTDIAVHLIETLRPHLLMLSVPEVDYAQHSAGPFSTAALAAVENADRQIARLIAAAKKAKIWNETVLVVVSDHGFARISQRVRPALLLVKKGLITLDQRNRITDGRASIVASVAQAYVYLRDPKDVQTPKALLDIFVPLAGKPGSGIGRIYKQEEIRKKGGDASAYLAFEAADGFEIVEITEGYRVDYISPSVGLGAHGYDPDRPDMLAALLFYGPAVAAGRIERARLIDVAPTVADWLGLKLERAEGTPLPIRLQTR